MSIEIQKIKDSLRLSEIIGTHVKLTNDGQEYRGLCPFHNEKTPSFTVVDKKKFYRCFGCGAHGDVFDWFETALHMDKQEALSYGAALAGMGEYRGTQPVLKVSPAEPPRDDDGVSDEWTPILPVPADAPPLFAKPDRCTVYNVKRSKESTFYPKMVFPYLAADGALLGYVIRIEIDGKKLTPQLTYAEHRDGTRRWCVLHMPTPRPIYGQEQLAARLKAPVVLVEGEKAKDAAQRLLPNAVVVTWAGGTKGINRVQWEPLAGRNVVYWRDADISGLQSAWGYVGRDGKVNSGIQQIIGTACRLVVIDPPEGVAEGWDAADAEAEGWDTKRTGSWLTERVAAAGKRGIVPPIPDPKATPKPAPKPAEPPPPTHAEEPPLHDLADYDDAPYYGAPDYDADLKAPFIALGHYKGAFFYLPNRSRQILEVQAMQHRELNMMQLAPLSYWESTFPAKGGQTKVDWKLAADVCIQECYRKGFFDPKTRIRGRGAWLDDGRSVLHLGDSLVVNGVKMAPHLIKSKYTYQADHSISVPPAPAVHPAQARELLEILKQFDWEHPRSALLIAGAMVIFPVCGILHWRPHMWINGGSGSGKSTIQQNIFVRVLGQLALYVSSSTTESGIRQELGMDARPVVFNEAESEDKNAAQRVQSILELCRAASDESGSRIIKGSAGHSSVSFQIRSCFTFFSVNTAVKQYADARRITILTLRSPDKGLPPPERQVRKDRYDALIERIERNLTPEFCSGLLQRTLELLPILQRNIITFTSAATIVLGDKAAADQLAPMIAGAHLLHSNKMIDLDAAIKWMNDNDMRETTVLAQAEEDEYSLLQRLLGHRLRVNTLTGQADRTVGELIEAAHKKDAEGAVCGVIGTAAYAELLRFGVKCDQEKGFWVSNNSIEIKRLLADTAWHSNWARPLRTLKDAITEKNPVKFAGGIRARAVWLPIHYVVE